MSTRQSSSILLRDALAYIDANFDKTVSLAQLAEISALSVSRFATVFRQQVGLSVGWCRCGHEAAPLTVSPE